MNIVEASKILAVYMGMVYVPFAAHQRATTVKPGWYRTYKLGTCHPLIENSIKHKNGFSRQLDENTLGKFVCRNHTQLRFFNSFDELSLVVAKLEKEDLSEYMYKWELEDETMYNFDYIEVSVDTNYVGVDVNLSLDPPMQISTLRPELPKRQQLFWALADAVEYINNLKLKNGK